jgi:D-lactate dehydrogenase (cytochrome)
LKYSGTLGIVVEATLKLQNIPQYRTVALCNYPTLKDAANTVIQMLQHGVRIGKVELMGNHSINRSIDQMLFFVEYNSFLCISDIFVDC